AKLGVRLLFAKPYSPEGTGKIERFNQNIDRFLDEYKVDKMPKTLEQMNDRFWVWLEECYQNKSHSALGNKTPVEAYHLDPKPLKYLPVDVVANAFLHSESRRVDKSGCISFGSVKYEVGLAYVGRMVDVIFDPNNTETLTVEYQDDPPLIATKLLIGEKVSERPPLPEYLTAIKPSESRLLEAAKRENDKRKEKTSATAISFRNMRNGGGGNV
ncbi:integrase core domain-containing protein, partial [Proteiniclasticum ruminis]